MGVVETRVGDVILVIEGSKVASCCSVMKLESIRSTTGSDAASGCSVTCWCSSVRSTAFAAFVEGVGVEKVYHNKAATAVVRRDAVRKRGRSKDMKE